MLKLDVVIITYKRRALLQRCLESVLKRADVKVIVVASGDDPETRDYLESLRSACENIEPVYLKGRFSKSAARNIALNRSDADMVFFLDDDSFVGDGTIKKIIEKFAEHGDVDVIGGPNITPEGSSGFQRAAGYALSSAFIAWSMRKRFKMGKKERFCDDRMLTLCNLAFRKKVFEGMECPFDERLYYNEENLLLQRMKMKGVKMLYCPGAYVYHQRRNNIALFAEQVFRSGEGRALMTAIMPGSFLPVYSVPVLALGFALLGRGPLLAGLVLLYCGSALLNALFVTIREKENRKVFFALCIMPFAAHFSYALGTCAGLLRIPFACKKKNLVSTEYAYLLPETEK
ncbi:MAG: glycosyltransferase [Endomicrobiales bacterium]|nr:glycosyltransferase [Endomicrobiales bacterium]